MALTPLEVIAEKLKEKTDAELESILSVSGSSAIAKNEYNVTVVDNTNVASSLLFKPLTKTKLDDVELVKAVNTEIKELKPDIPAINLDLVPRPLYTEKVTENEDLRQQVMDLTSTVSTLNQQVSDLKSQVQTEINNRLSIEQTNDVLANQLDTLGGTVQDFTGQIATSLQKSVDESILRTSLQAQNTGFKAQIEALIKQIDSLNSIIEGLQSQLGAVQNQQAIIQGTQAQAMAAGADVINEVCIVKVNKINQTDHPFFGKIHGRSGNKWVNGKSVDFTNNDKQPVSITIEISSTQGMQWFSASESSFELAAGAQKTINMIIDENATKNVDSKQSGKFSSYSHSANYKGGSVRISVKRNDGSVKDKGYEASFDKMHPDSF